MTLFDVALFLAGLTTGLIIIELLARRDGR